MQFHTGHGFEARQAEINRNRPFPHRDIGPRHQRSCPHTEIRAAICAPVRHRFGIRNFFGVCAAAMSAAALTIWPDAIFKPLNRRFIRRKHIHHFNKCDALAVRFSERGVRHIESPILVDSDIRTGGRFVKYWL